ncbi:MAG: threonine ammonia-lyase IlvA [Rhodobacteraceae bacterium]|nr:threonine ammonia-lyase IlvA [Paracoccaceae bacterium]
MAEFPSRVSGAVAQMRTLFDATPLQRNAYLSEKYGAEVFLKREDLSPIRSYKIRGAFNAMRKVLAHDAHQTLFVCASAGNHAQGVAYVCRHFGVSGVIYMPVTTPQQKIDKTRAFGGDFIEIVLEGDYFDETLKAAQDYCAAETGSFLAPFDDPNVIEGQATVAAEIITQLRGDPLDMLILPVGGGGLSSGIVQYFREIGQEVAYRFVEPSGAGSLKAALKAGEVVTLKHIDSFVDGAAVARIGTQNFEILKTVNPDDVLAAPEGRICGTITDILNVEGIVLEPAGALAIDALQDVAAQIKGKRVVCVTSGGNFDFERLPDVKERALKYAGLKKYFVLRMPQRPGALRDFLQLLGPEDDIARFEYLKKSARNFGAVLLGIETKHAEGFASLCARMTAEGFEYTDITDDEILSELLI